MKALLLVHKEFSEFCIFCPFCKKMTEDLEYDDYVKTNCLFWCHNCGEILICPTGYNDKNDEIQNLINGKVVNSCSKKLSLNEAKSLIKDIACVWKEEWNQFRAYMVGILRITFLSRVPFDGMTNSDDDNSDNNTTSSAAPAAERSELWDVDVMRFSDLPKNVDHSHDGVYLYYKATCSECNKHYESFIWGD